MKYFQDKVEFEKNMKKIKEILERKGFVTESDHSYAHQVQCKEAIEDVEEWLLNNGYEGEIETMGANYRGVDEYGLYDASVVTFEEMHKKLLDEAEKEYYS